jgi:tetratricopeptide (TPR) repeat protein
MFRPALCLVVALSARALAQAPAGGQLDASPALFAVLAAANAAGYDAEIRSPSNHPLRTEVRRYVQGKNPAVLPRLKAFLAERKLTGAGGDLSQYISYALSVDGPPAFKPRYSGIQMPPGALALEGLSPLLAEFWEQADLDSAWRAVQPAFDQVITRYHAPVSEAILAANLYLRNPTSGARGRRFQIYIDLLGAPNQVHTRSFGDDYFIVVTSSAEPRVKDIRRAYLHYLLDPLAIRNQAALEKKKGLGDLAQGSPILDDVYKEDFVLLTSMSLVRGVEARLEGKAGPAMAEQAMKEGFILAGYFYEALGVYEKQEQAFRIYLPEMFEKIDLAREDKRIAQIEFAGKRETRAVKVPAPAAEAPTGIEADLQQGEDLYRQRKLEEARDVFRKVLDARADPAQKAKAYYGLARIAALEKQPELAVQLFERTLELAPEPFERAWTLVYLARLAKAAEDDETARKHYQAALAVQGASEAARKAASAELAALGAAGPKSDIKQ